jgi:hypothetical protein
MSNDSATITFDLTTWNQPQDIENRRKQCLLDIFSRCLRLKVKMALSNRLYQLFWFDPTHDNHISGLDPEQNATVSEHDVKFCIFPALYSYPRPPLNKFRDLAFHPKEVSPFISGEVFLPAVTDTVTNCSTLEGKRLHTGAVFI